MATDETRAAEGEFDIELGGEPGVHTPARPEETGEGILIGEDAQEPTRRTKQQPPRIERLATSYFQKLWDGTPLKADEEIVRLCLDPMWPMGDLREDINAWRATVALTRTATVFVLDQEDVDMVMSSMREDAVVGDGNVHGTEMTEADDYAKRIEETTGAPLMPEASVWREHSEAVARGGLSDHLNEDSGMSLDEMQAKVDEIRGNPDATEDELLFARELAEKLNAPEGTYGLADKTSMYETAADGFDPYAEIDLPPLPYPRMSIEVTTPQGYPAAIYASKPAGQGGNHPVMLLNETEPGKVWDIFFPSVEPRGESELWNFRLTNGGGFEIPATILKPDNPHGKVVDPAKVNSQTSPRAARFWRRLTLDLVSLILAENVPHAEVAVPRQHRRAVERNFDPKKRGYKFPTIYWVRLAEAGERTEGASGRVYTQRWLVRGHWRQYGKGEVLLKGGKKRTYTGKRVWVKPHIKGPVGAPWKGRPIYRGNAVEKASDFDQEHIVVQEEA